MGLAVSEHAIRCHHCDGVRREGGPACEWLVQKFPDLIRDGTAAWWRFCERDFHTGTRGVRGQCCERVHELPAHLPERDIGHRPENFESQPLSAPHTVGELKARVFVKVAV